MPRWVVRRVYVSLTRCAISCACGEIYHAAYVLGVTLWFVFIDWDAMNAVARLAGDVGFRGCIDISGKRHSIVANRRTSTAMKAHM